MIRALFTIILLCLPGLINAQFKLPIQDSIRHRIILVGDAGDPGAIVKGKAAVIDAIRNTVQMDEKTVVLFLGDNIYVNGLPCEGDVCYIGAINVLDSQASLVANSKAKAYFMPGNHDWANGKPVGYDNILRQGAYLNNLADNVRFLPEDGCPGPVEVPLGPDAVMIIMDSQWWLLRGEKPGIESDCDTKTEDEILDELKDILEHNSNKLVIFAAHHPFKSSGVHSGYFGLKQHLFPFTDINKYLYIPLPGIGSIYPISRSVFGGPQDLKFPLYANMINKVDEVLKSHPYVIHVAGHEHNLQYISDSNYNYIVSGAGCKTQRVAKNKKTKFVSSQRGFAVMDVSVNKTVQLTFFELNAKNGETEQAYTKSILNFSKFPELAADTVTVHETVYKDSVTAPVNVEYDKASGFKRLILGDNYRKEWATPVSFKVFNLKKTNGGYKIDRLGGGNQTRSLRLKDSEGTTWTLRTLNKNPEKVIPQNFRNTFASDIVQDMISAANPYGALVLPRLEEALGIVHSTPKYYFIPDDYSFSKYRPVFANNVCMIEEFKPTLDNSGKDYSTMKVFNKQREKSNHIVDQKALLTARMLDFLVSDYDRHQDQWKWGMRDSGRYKVYYPIPHDRDQAFFYSEGLIMDYATWRRLPFLKGFKYRIPRIKWQGYVARYFDRQYLNEIDENQWRLTLADFRERLSDEVIHDAVRMLPPEIARMDSGTIAGKLISRRDLLPEKSLIYYRFLSRRVNVLGSNNDEFFHISENGRGLMLSVRSRTNDGDTLTIYTRRFDPHVTKEIRLYGFNGNDRFNIDSNANSRIKVIMIGGVGSDTFDLRGRVPNAVYDFRKEGNRILARRKTRNMITSDPLVNVFDEKEENYTWWRYPHLEMGYNVEDGFMIGAGVFARTYNFRKKPFASDQRVTSLFALGNQAYQVKYTGEFRNIFRRYDLALEGEFVNPTLNNFFGFGNETKKLPGTNIYSYRVRYSDAAGTAQLRKRLFNDVVSIGIGPTYYHYFWNSNRDNSDRLIAHPSILGLDSDNVYTSKSYAGGLLSIKVNNVNAELFPTRGVDWNTSFVSMQGVSGNAKPLTKFESNMTVYASVANFSNLVALLRLGGGHIFSKNFEYYQALTLGANNYLRGFRKDRFAGSSVAYADIELRVKLLDVRSYIIPGTLGVVGFNDFGRVWMENERSGLWHDAYGGGLYYTPFNMVIIAVTTAFSGEEALFNFTVGSKINLTF